MIDSKLVKEEMKLESTCNEQTISEEIINKEDDELKSTKEEMGEVREENERLKIELSKLMKNYQSLKTHYFHIAKQEPTNQTGKTLNPAHQEEDHDLVSLTLGRHIIKTLPPHKNEKKIHILNEGEKHNVVDDDKFVSQGLKLGLDCRFEPTLNGPSNEIGVEEKHQEEERSESLKTMRSGDDVLLQQTQLKRARVSVRARCDTPTMNDGCQWRKYGQKIAKGNPCPRAYYRCTISTTCPVRKQAQRCANDMSILITTYEGTHNHPLPISATAMASTTSAAASMLQSGSSSSTSRASYDTPVNMTTTTSGATSSSHGSKHMLPQHLFNFANSSISTLNSHPTITLDLTTSQQQPIWQNFNRFSSLSKYPANCLNFSSSSTTSCLESFSTKPWGNSYLSYDTPSYNRSNEASSQAQLYQGNYMQTNNRNRYQKLPTLTENTLAAATKAAISSDPTFRSAIEAAITSLVSNNGGVGKSSQKLKWSYP